MGFRMDKFILIMRILKAVCLTIVLILTIYVFSSAIKFTRIMFANYKEFGIVNMYGRGPTYSGTTSTYSFDMKYNEQENFEYIYITKNNCLNITDVPIEDVIEIYKAGKFMVNNYITSMRITKDGEISLRCIINGMVYYLKYTSTNGNNLGINQIKEWSIKVGQ